MLSNFLVMACISKTVQRPLMFGMAEGEWDNTEYFTILHLSAIRLFTDIFPNVKLLTREDVSRCHVKCSPRAEALQVVFLSFKHLDICYLSKCGHIKKLN